MHYELNIITQLQILLPAQVIFLPDMYNNIARMIEHIYIEPQSPRVSGSVGELVSSPCNIVINEIRKRCNKYTVKNE